MAMVIINNTWAKLYCTWRNASRPSARGPGETPPSLGSFLGGGSGPWAGGSGGGRRGGGEVPVPQARRAAGGSSPRRGAPNSQSMLFDPRGCARGGAASRGFGQNLYGKMIFEKTILALQNLCGGRNQWAPRWIYEKAVRLRVSTRAKLAKAVQLLRWFSGVRPFAELSLRRRPRGGLTTSRAACRVEPCSSFTGRSSPAGTAAFREPRRLAPLNAAFGWGSGGGSALKPALTEIPTSSRPGRWRRPTCQKPRWFSSGQSWSLWMIGRWLSLNARHSGVSPSQ